MHGVLTRPRRRHLAALALTLTAAFTVVFASPAGAGSSHASAASAYCGPSLPAEFDTIGMLSGASAARGANGVTREPDLGASEEVPASAKGKGGKNFRVTVPTWFHVVHDGSTAKLTNTQLQAQLQALNMGFGGFEGGYDTGFRFKLAGVTYTDNAAWLNHGYGDKTERDMKKALHRGGRDTLNVYFTNAANLYLGWAYFPNLTDSRLYLDGTVVHWESVPGASDEFAGAYDLGKTLTHEAGHWINLHHVFNGGCNNWGDYVEDTPPQRIATFRCPEGQDSCNEPGIDSIHNYMDYSFDSCYNQFTKGQAARMQDAWLHFRANG